MATTTRPFEGPAETQRFETFEDIDSHIKNTYTPAIAESAVPQKVDVAQLRAIWKVVRPILKAVVGMPFIPNKWKKPLNQFISMLDALA